MESGKSRYTITCKFAVYIHTYTSIAAWVAGAFIKICQTRMAAVSNLIYNLKVTAIPNIWECYPDNKRSSSHCFGEHGKQ